MMLEEDTAVFYKMGNHLKTAFRNLIRNSWMSTAAISTVMVCLLIAGTVVLLISNVNYFVDQVESELVIKVLLEDNIALDDKALLEERIRIHPMVNEVRYIDKEEGIELLKKQFGDNSAVLDGLDLNQYISDGYEVKVKDSAQISIVAEALKEFKGIEEIVYGKEYIADIINVTNIIRLVGIGLAIAVAIASTFVIFNTIRLTVLMRSDEITIMRYVGATNWYIRWPFILEGWLIGLFGSLVAGGILVYAYKQFAIWFSSLIQYVQVVPTTTINLQLWVFLAIGGSFLGIFGSTISMRKFLKL